MMMLHDTDPHSTRNERYLHLHRALWTGEVANNSEVWTPSFARGRCFKSGDGGASIWASSSEELDGALPPLGGQTIVLHSMSGELYESAGSQRALAECLYAATNWGLDLRSEGVVACLVKPGSRSALLLSTLGLRERSALSDSGFSAQFGTTSAIRHSLSEHLGANYRRMRSVERAGHALERAYAHLIRVEGLSFALREGSVKGATYRMFLSHLEHLARRGRAVMGGHCQPLQKSWQRFFRELDFDLQLLRTPRAQRASSIWMNRMTPQTQAGQFDGRCGALVLLAIEGFFAHLSPEHLDDFEEIVSRGNGAVGARPTNFIQALTPGLNEAYIWHEDFAALFEDFGDEQVLIQLEAAAAEVGSELCRAFRLATELSHLYEYDERQDFGKIVGRISAI